MDTALTRKQLVVDGQPRLMLAGEIHYFRIPRETWAAQLDLLAAAGANTVACYVPWVVHEAADGELDVTGARRPELDLGAFLDLAAERGLWAFVRPGPFTMGELRHEGVPSRLRTQYPHLIPLGWDGVPAPTSTLDYLHPDFLAETRRWYAALGPVLAPRTAATGGPVVGVQLDNEIGMLAWVSNSPDLTDLALAELTAWLDAHGRTAAYPVRDPNWPEVVRRPDPAWSAALRVDLADFMRERFARYVTALRGFATEAGFGGVPLYVNVHGTEASSALSLSIGISQLRRTWLDQPNLTAGSDHYLGTLTFAKAAELHLVHAFLDATLDADQPLTSLEFEAGTGDYGDGLADLTDPSAVVLKTRLLLAQGTRAFNWYLFSGGTNRVDPRPDDAGTHRFGITGERHGAAAPVTPEGRPGPAYASTAESIRLARAVEPWAAAWVPEHDDLAVGFVVDHWATEYAYGGNDVMGAVTAELKPYRGAGPAGLLPRMLLAGGFRYGAVDLQDDATDGWPRVIALGTGRVLAAEVQRRLLAHVEAGGGLLLHGDLPVLDAEGRPCRVLADALGLSVGPPVRAGAHDFTSVVGVGRYADVPELRVGTVSPLVGGKPVLRTAMPSGPGSGDAVAAVRVGYGAGQVAVIATDASPGPAFFARLLDELGVRPRLRREVVGPGLITLTTVAADGDRFVHLINVEGYPLQVRLWFDDEPLFGGTAVHLAPRSGQILAHPAARCRAGLGMASRSWRV